jgi:hypothetical protein
MQFTVDARDSFLFPKHPRQLGGGGDLPPYEGVYGPPYRAARVQSGRSMKLTLHHYVLLRLQRMILHLDSPIIPS